MINPYIAAGALAGVIAAFAYGVNIGGKLEREGQQRSEKAAQVAYDAAMKATAEQLANITITNTTIRQKAEVIVREKPVYRDCVHDASGLQSINSALSGQPVSNSELPRTDTAN